MRLIEVSKNDAKPIIKEGIAHIDDASISIDRFLSILKNLDKYTVTEKVDGSNLWAGIDIGERFFTSRSHKGGKEYFRCGQWGERFADVPFKCAHAALESKLDILRESGLNPGDTIELEILYSEKPNAIPYYPNQIIFLRTITGNPDIDKMSEMLEGIDTEINVHNIPITKNGKIIERIDEKQTWTFSKVHEYDIDFDKLNEEIKKPLYNLEKFLYAPNIAKFQLKEHVPLTPRWKDRRLSNYEMLRLRLSSTNKQAKAEVSSVYESYKKEIKDILLNQLVRNQKSMLGPKDGWIEGVVLRRETNEGVEQIKLVDKDIFTAVNKFNHQVRNYLLEKHRSTKTPNEKAGIRGNLLRDLATVIGYPELGTYQANKCLESLDKSLMESSKTLNQAESCLKIIERNEKLLEKMLENYIDQYQTKEFIDSIGRIHKYDSIIHERTLQVFAEMFNEMDKWKEIIKEAKTIEPIIKIIVGDKI